MTIQKTSENVFKVAIFIMKVTAESLINEIISLSYFGNSQKDIYST